jgi:hypothetical protein
MPGPRLGRHKSAEQWRRQLARRGWTPEQIQQVIVTGARYPARNYVNLGNTATRYVSRETGKSVVVNDQTGEVLHVGGSGFQY